MKKLLLATLIMCCSVSLLAQDYNPNRYRESIFSDVLTITDVKYGEAPQWIWPYWDIDLELDVHVPDGDMNPKRPLIIFAHSGGFINGSKGVDNMVAICDSFALKGYVTATIDYRKGFDPLDGASAERAVYRAVQDGKAAVRYFKENASLYDIDTNNIYFGGMSAGGYIALHVAYMDKETERPESSYGGGLVNDLECLDCAGNDFEHSSKVKAILDFWGGVDDTTIIEEGNIPMMIMHGENDGVVPFEYGHPFGLFTLPETYGGLPISERAENMGIHYEFFTSEGTLHMLDGSDNGDFEGDSPNSFWSDTLLPESERFLFELLRPYTTQISESEAEICFGETIILEVSDSALSHYVWDYDTDMIEVIADDNSGMVELTFNNAGTFPITVVEFNCIMAAGDTISFTINAAEEIVPAFTDEIMDFNTVMFTNESTGGVTYAWDFGDDETSDEVSPSHTYDENGTYEVILEVTNDLGCSELISETIEITGLGIEGAGFAAVMIYPNPFNDLLMVQNAIGLEEIIVMDATGRVIHAQSQLVDNEITIDTYNWASGMYIVKLQADNGNFRTEKLFKK